MEFPQLQYFPPFSGSKSCPPLKGQLKLFPFWENFCSTTSHSLWLPTSYVWKITFVGPTFPYNIDNAGYSLTQLSLQLVRVWARDLGSSSETPPSQTSCEKKQGWCRIHSGDQWGLLQQQMISLPEAVMAVVPAAELVVSSVQVTQSVSSSNGCDVFAIPVAQIIYSIVSACTTSKPSSLLTEIL